jgi:hypothetical protein
MEPPPRHPPADRQQRLALSSRALLALMSRAAMESAILVAKSRALLSEKPVVPK